MDDVEAIPPEPGKTGAILVPRSWVWGYLFLMFAVTVSAIAAYVAYDRAAGRLQGNADLVAEVDALRRQNRAVAELEYELRQLRDMQEQMLGLAGIKPALGVSKEMEEAALKSSLVWPVEGVIRREFAASTHPTVEIGTRAKQPIAAAGDGMVSEVSESDSLGFLVELVHDGGFETSYQGLQITLVAEGDSVDAGQVIGLVGSLGSQAPRLVFGVRFENTPVNPREVVRETFPTQ